MFLSSCGNQHCRNLLLFRFSCLCTKYVLVAIIERIIWSGIEMQVEVENNKKTIRKQVCTMIACTSVIQVKFDYIWNSHCLFEYAVFCRLYSTIAEGYRKSTYPFNYLSKRSRINKCRDIPHNLQSIYLAYDSSRRILRMCAHYRR